MTDAEFTPVLIGKLMNIGGMLQRKANQLLLPFGLNQQQFSILFEINKAERVNQKTMVNRLDLEKSHVSKIVKKLHGMELIDIGSSDDKRETWLTMTPAGKEKVRQCQKRIGEWNSLWADKIDKNDRGIILDNLSMLQDVFREYTSND